ncbi:zinc-binding dehydrogenase [Micropruina glycogenica]|uniref:Alcohol dehydrogenase-like C-terminal domain-containing protein n=1 Tax=Micropruina glycogenica TaxID=75385 RepID=A0A2N9JCW3_9ACTN|nr:zinc-binding dehydrogenase [Micropruina glycogenica]SPD85338.1 protein of unknown function [Micropruina glycogenica]
MIGVKPDVVAAFAQLVAVPARNVVPLPDGMPTTHGALVEPLAVATHAVGRLNPPDGPVLVAGGGPIGQSVAVVLRQVGVRQVLVSEPAAERRELLTALGVTALNPGDAPVAEQVLAVAGRPAVAAFDAVGSSGSVADCLAATELGASVCLIGGDASARPGRVRHHRGRALAGGQLRLFERRLRSGIGTARLHP